MKDQINYLNQSIAIVKNQITVSNLAKKDLETEEATKFYLQLEENFKNSFPDYKLSYMIQYGVYGLVQSLLK